MSCVECSRNATQALGYRVVRCDPKLLAIAFPAAPVRQRLLSVLRLSPGRSRQGRVIDGSEPEFGDYAVIAPSLVELLIMFAVAAGSTALVYLLSIVIPPNSSWWATITILTARRSPVTRLEPMDISDLSIAELRALHGVLEHWLRAWDWECPTLFGFERSDLSKLLEDWPLSLQAKPHFAALAVQGVLRETLYGASTIAADRLPAVCGLSRADLECLAQHLWPRLDAAQN